MEQNCLWSFIKHQHQLELPTLNAALDQTFVWLYWWKFGLLPDLSSYVFCHCDDLVIPIGT